MSDIIVKNVDAETKRNAVYVLACKGKNLSDAVREMLAKYAEEFNKYKEE